MSDLPYLCDFEDEEQNAEWILNPRAEELITNNRWVVGDAVAYAGTHSLYVSNDNGATMRYSKNNNLLLACMTVTLNAGDYDVAYDWCGMGNKQNGYVKVVLANFPLDNQLRCQGNNVEPNWLANGISCMGEYTTLGGEENWQHVEAHFSIPSSLAGRTTTKLVFVWVNTDKAPDYGQAPFTSVAIDNLQLSRHLTDNYPNNIFVLSTEHKATISWEGEADSYEILYRSKTEDEFVATTSSTSELILEGVEYGAYEFWIRGTYAGETTIYTVFPVVFLYETDCFDALNMYNATFSYGQWAAPLGVVKRAEMGTNRVDYGYSDIRSRHTTHYLQDEYDRFTNGKLKTVPKGHFGSLRLGNWNTGSEYESIRFRYEVKSDDNAVLLLNYAIVLENPEHEAVDQPRFFLTIYNEEGKEIDTKCAQVDFHAPTGKELQDTDLMSYWHTDYYTSGEANASARTINWQDWRSIGVDLSAYKGQTLTVEFTTYDCNQGGHFGYAYLTLNCSHSDVDGLPWGDGSTTQMFIAPDGFNYEWYEKPDTDRENLLSTERDYEVNERDTMTYICVVTYPTNDECGFEFEATAKPHNPVAEIQYDWRPVMCKNGIYVRNACHVGLTNQITGEVEHRYDKRIEWCRWTMPDGTEETDSLYYDGFYVPISNEGDTLTYSIWCGVVVHGVLFESDTTVTIIVPAIGPVETHLYDTICQGQSIEYPAGSRQLISTSGTYDNPIYSHVTGCDSTVYLHLWVHQPKYYTYADTVCADQPYQFFGRDLLRSGIYKQTVTSVETGCDSVVTLEFTRAEYVDVKIVNADLCGDENVVFRVSGLEWADSVVVEAPGQPGICFAGRREQDQLIIKPGVMRAGAYEAKVTTYLPWCEASVQKINFNMSLGANVWNVKFGNLLALYTAEYNGGYEIESVQWYADGELIPGATEPNYLIPSPVDETVQYSARVVLKDGTELLICPASISERMAMGEENVISNMENGIRKVLLNSSLYIGVGGELIDIFGRRL